MHVIDGREVPSLSERTFDSINPATGERLATVAFGEAEDVDRAIDSAARAFARGDWAGLPPAERGRRMRRVARLIEERADDLAQMLIFDDADIEAAQGVIMSRSCNAGQTCICTNRLHAQRPLLEKFSQRVAEIAKGLKVGDGLDPETKVGPMIDERGYAKVEEQVKDALAGGATVLASGKPASLAAGLKGYFYEPTILADVAPDAKILHDETFGPALPIVPFDTEEEGIRLANDTSFGLAAYLFTRDIGRAFRVSEGLEYGSAGIDDPVPTAPQIPFGGFKESGLGRENGSMGIDEFMEVKAVTIVL